MPCWIAVAAEGFFETSVKGGRVPKPELSHLASFPWATLGRNELESEFWQKIEEQSSRANLFDKGFEVTFLVTVENESTPFASQTWESLIAQSFPYWRALFICSRSYFERNPAPSDPRIQWLEIPEGLPLWAAKNRGLDQVTDSWVGVVSLGDVVSPAALYLIALEQEKQPERFGFYTLECSLAGKRTEFLSKADFNPYAQAHWNTVGRFWLVKRSVLEPFEELPAGFEEQVALLRLGICSTLALVPYYLYYSRSQTVTKPTEAVAQAVETTLKSLSPHCGVKLHEDGRLQVVPNRLDSNTRISAVVCFRDKALLTARAVDSILKSQGTTPLEVLLVDNGSCESELQIIESRLSEWKNVRLVHFPGVFNYARMHNWAIREHCTGNVICFLNNDVELARVDLDLWASWAREPKVATVGIRLYFEDGRLQHAGVRAWFGGEAHLVRVGNVGEADRQAFGFKAVFASTFAACMVKREAYELLGGLREKEMVNGFGDVAFCLEAIRQGWTNLYLGYFCGSHAESSSRGVSYEYWEEFALERQYAGILNQMLRQDCGINRVPANASFVRIVLGAFRASFRLRSVWLDPFKPALKNFVIGLKKIRRVRHEVQR